MHPRRKRFRRESEGERVETFTYMDDIYGIMASTIRGTVFLRRELEDIDISESPAKTVVFPPKGRNLDGGVDFRSLKVLPSVLPRKERGRWWAFRAAKRIAAYHAR